MHSTIVRDGNWVRVERVDNGAETLVFEGSVDQAMASWMRALNEKDDLKQIIEQLKTDREKLEAELASRR